MTQVHLAELIEEALKMEGKSKNKWSFSYQDTVENSGTDVRANIELKYLGTPNSSESFSLLHPRTLGATNATEQKEDFINSVREKIRLLSSRVGNG